MLRRVAVCLLVIFLAGGPRLSAAQDHDILSAGMRARLTLLLRDERATGVLAVSSADSVALIDNAGTRRIFRSVDLRRIEVFTGRHSRVRRSAAVGGALGAALGALAGLSSGDACGVDAYQTCTRAESALGGAVLGGLVGGVVGLIVGIPRRDTWRSIRPPWHVAPAPAPTR